MAHRARPRKTRWKPQILRKEVRVTIRLGYRLNIGLNHYASLRKMTKSRLIREAVEYYFKWQIPKFKNRKRHVNKVLVTDYSKELIVDYSFAFDDSLEIPIECDREEFYD